MRYRHKTHYRTSNPKFAALAKAANRLGADLNAHGSVPPIKTVETVDGCVHTWDPWESPFRHPWRVYRPDVEVAKVNVEGGTVNTGLGPVAVAGLTNIVPADGLKVWLSVRYNNGATADTLELVADTGDWPENDYETDAIPATGDPTILPTAGWSVDILRVAEIQDGVLLQYLYSDVLLEKGRTYQIDRVVGHRWLDTVFQHIVASELVVRGILRTAAVRAVDVFDTGDCP